MKIKSYFARTVEASMAAARQELGPDAMLLNSRKTPLESRHLGEYEVVFATLAPGSEAATASTLKSNPRPQPSGDRLATEVADLKKELESMRRALTRSALASPPWGQVAPDLSDAYAMLTASDVAPELAREIVQAAESRQARSTESTGAAAFQRALLAEMELRFRVAPTLGK